MCKNAYCMLSENDNVEGGNFFTNNLLFHERNQGSTICTKYSSSSWSNVKIKLICVTDFPVHVIQCAAAIFYAYSIIQAMNKSDNVILLVYWFREKQEKLKIIVFVANIEFVQISDEGDTHTWKTMTLPFKILRCIKLKGLACSITFE